MYQNNLLWPQLRWASVSKKIPSLVFIALTFIANLSSIYAQSDWAYETNDTQAVASDVWLPIASFFLPGTGQWARGQYEYGAIYTGIAFGSYHYATYARAEIDQPEEISTFATTKDLNYRKYLWGLQTVQASGGLSLYHTFRSAVWQRQKFNEYKFLNEGSSIKDILLAPFQFQFLGRPSTWIPLLAITGASWYLLNHPSDDYLRTRLDREDPYFAAGFSYNAGTHEEAMFRGWMMPLLYETGFSANVSNFGQAALFAIAHANMNKLPLPQLFLGLHLGNVTQKNQWSISESVFIHTWWDIVAFLASYSLEKKQGSISFHLSESSLKKQNLQRSQKIFHKKNSLHLPPIIYSF